MKSNMTPRKTASAFLQSSVSPHDTALICTELLKDLIAAVYLGKEMYFLACDPSKVERARKASKEETDKNVKKKIIGIG